MLPPLSIALAETLHSYDSSKIQFAAERKDLSSLGTVIINFHLYRPYNFLERG
jgi:hypothetical protein